MSSEGLLFVCAGNTCRSPMAAAIARRSLKDANIESAGLVPGYAVAVNAVRIVAELTGTDISGHEPKALEEFELSSFEKVIALDAIIAEEIRAHIPAGVELVVWNIRDPYGGSLEDYRRSAESIQDAMSELVRGR
ncbi:MAG: low molecular weight phosphatase family protein [Actinobacteria bacterium]|nr:low molecular weight phosphatase family protein [Actinomycetota bacterium]